MAAWRMPLYIEASGERSVGMASRPYVFAAPTSIRMRLMIGEKIQGVPRAVNESLNRMGLELVPQDLLRLQESRIPRRCHGTPVAQIL